jgi:ComF family protein
VLLPATCPACGRPGPAPCGHCRARFTAAARLATPAGADSCRALLSYDGAGRALIAGLKYRNARSALPWLAAGLADLAAEALAEGAVAGRGPDSVVVTWVPTTSARRHRRGFDQSRLLACAVAARLGLRCPRLLRRLPGPPQTGLSVVERRLAPLFVPAAACSPRSVVLVDDVVTTGSTVAAAAVVLRASGATSVDVVAVARTPRSDTALG